jgi:hypothetical protein
VATALLKIDADPSRERSGNLGLMLAQAELTGSLATSLGSPESRSSLAQKDW